MKKFKQFPLVLLVYLLITSCNTGPKNINYGSDGCHFCKMTIVDKIHGAELVTEKGKVYKFDAAECMLNYIQDNPSMEVDNFYTNYHENPTELIPVTNAFFLISEAIPSPMGANLTAFKTKENAQKIHSEMGGKLYSWETLKTHLDK